MGRNFKNHNFIFLKYLSIDCVYKIKILFDRANYMPYFTHKQTKAQQGSRCVQVTCQVDPRAEPCQLY